MSNVDLTDILKEQIPIEDRHAGYLVDLEGIQFEQVQNSDGETVDASWVHALSLGEFKHPLWGTLLFDMARIRRFAQNVNNKVRGIDPSIDYGHFSSGEAAGWVQKAEARKTGLWIFVEWTKTAADKIRNKEYRYFSSDFSDEWIDEHTGKTYKDVLFGGGLTNRPFLKNLVPVNLSELYGKGKEKESMELTDKLREALGLSEEATEEEALEAIKKLSEKPADPPQPKNPPEPSVDPALPKELAEHPVVKSLMDQVTELQTERRLSEANRMVESWTTHTSDEMKFALPPAVTETLSDVLVGGSSELRTKLSEVFESILKSGLVQLGEMGRTRGSGSTDNGEYEGGPAAEIDRRVKELMEKDPKMSFGDAYAEVSRDEKLFAEYRAGAFAGSVTDTLGDEEGEA